MKKQTMVDIESLSLKPNAAILSIGAVKFDMKGIQDEFYVNIRELDHSVLRAQGFDVDRETVKWWAEQSPEAKAVLQTNVVSLGEALALFSDWLGEDCPGLWGNGSDFDNSAIKNAYQIIGAPVPWSYKANRCYRTIKSLYPEIKAERFGVHHYALDDAKYQALHLIQIFTQVFSNPADRPKEFQL